MRLQTHLKVLIVTILGGVISLDGRAQPVFPSLPARQPTESSINAQLAAISEDQGLEEAAAKEAQDLLQRALIEIKRVSQLSADTAKLRTQAEQAPELLQAIRAELARSPAEPNLPNPDARALSQLEQELLQATAVLQGARQTVTDLQLETTQRGERQGIIPQQIARIREQLAENPGLAASEGEPTSLFEARRTLLIASQLAKARELEFLEAEAASYEARRELLPARRDQAQRRVGEAERLVQALQALVSNRRQADVEQAAREAQRQRQDTAQQHPDLKRFADETANRAAQRAGPGSLSERIDSASRRAAAFRAQAAELGTRFASVQQRVEATGLSRATGLQLRRLYESLPDRAELRRDLRRNRKALDNTEYDQIELTDERLAAGDIDRAVQELISGVSLDGDGATAADVELIARDLATSRRDLLDLLIADQLRYRGQLSALIEVESELLTQTREQADYIEERILWVRSVESDDRPSIASLRQGIAWLFDPGDWRVIGSQCVAYASAHRLLVASIGVLLMALWASGFRARLLLRRTADKVSRYSTDRFAYTIAALLLTALLAAPAPLALYALGWILDRSSAQLPLGIAFGYSLRAVAVMIFPLLFLRHALRAQGLCEAHFRWPAKQTRPIRRALRWFLPVVVPMALLVLALDRGADEAANATLGRLLFTAGLIALSAFLHRVVRPTGPVLRRYVEANRSGPIYRLRRVWHPLIVFAPILFAALSWFGFYYTAMRLEARFEESLVLIVSLVFADAILLRWLFVVRRRVAVEDARRRREQAATESETPRDAGGTPLSSGIAVDDEKVDLPSLSGQTRQLFRAAIAVAAVVGLFVIWAEAMPALRQLDRVHLWPTVEVVDRSSAGGGKEPVSQASDTAIQNGTAMEAAGTPTPLSSTQAADQTGAVPDTADEPDSIITLADAGLAIVVLIATWLAFRNVPGLIEIILLQRLPLDAGSRYALSTVLRYLIAIVGIVIAFNSIGITWGKVQWLAAALTFGLAFGLQEVFANFVSGLIILAERPIRIGDTVTVGGVSGTVTRIRMRATTIADWDRKELIIPNKTFITSDVINWTLSDSVLRVSIPVGVSYESDVVLVEKTLLRVATENQIVLEDPAPQVIFKRFGDSTLDFELRVFIPGIDHFVPIRHKLNNAVINAFRAADIEIAFPQRDLHLRSVSDLDKIMSKDPRPGSNPNQS